MTSEHRKTVDKLFTALTDGDIDRAVDYFSDDVEMNIPFQPDGFWNHMSGRVALSKFLGSLPGIFSTFAIAASESWGFEAPGGLAVRYHTDATVSATGKPYKNDYLGLFFFDAAKVSTWTEFHNPLVLLEATRP